MKNYLKNIWLAVLLAVISAPMGWSQATMRSTTLAAAVAKGDSTISVASATGIAVGMTYVVDRESGRITSISGTTLGVTRTNNNSAHTSGETVYVDLANYFGLDPSGTGIPFGSCTSTAELVLPRVDPATGDLYRCTNSEWDREVSSGRLKSKLDLDLNLQTTSENRVVKINSRDYSGTTGDISGFQVKPNQTVSKTANGVFGGEISPRLADGVGLAGASGVLMGLNIDPLLKGTTARTIGADYRVLNLEAVTDDAGTSTISGDVIGIRVRAAFSATTITGDMVPFRVEKAEAQTNSQSWDALFKLTGSGTGTEAWGSDTGSGDTEGGYIAVLTDFDGNGVYTKMYLVLYSDAP